MHCWRAHVTLCPAGSLCQFQHLRAKIFRFGKPQPLGSLSLVWLCVCSCVSLCPCCCFSVGWLAGWQAGWLGWVAVLFLSVFICVPAYSLLSFFLRACGLNSMQLHSFLDGASVVTDSRVHQGLFGAPSGNSGRCALSNQFEHQVF